MPVEGRRVDKVEPSVAGRQKRVQRFDFRDFAIEVAEPSRAEAKPRQITQYGGLGLKRHGWATSAQTTPFGNS